MNAEQKQQSQQAIEEWNAVCNDDPMRPAGDVLAAMLEELINAPESEPVDRVTGYYAGYLSIATVDGRVLPAGTALYAAPTPAEAPADVAQDAALYCAVQRACAELPEGWEIRIELERSAGTVSLVNPDGEDVDYPSDHEYMASDINDAIDSAIAAEKGGAK